MGFRRRLLPASALFLTASVGWSAPLWGRLAFVRDGAAWVADLGQGGLTRLPVRDPVIAVAVSPANGTALCGVGAGGAYSDLWRSRPPYTAAERLTCPNVSPVHSIEWSGDGRFAFVTGADRCWQYRTATAEITELPYRVLATSRDSAVVLVPRGDCLVARRRDTGREVSVWSSERPAPLRRAVHRAHLDHWLRDFRGLGDRPSGVWDDHFALAPDGRWLYVATDLGVTLPTAQSPFLVFRADTRTGALECLAWLDGQLSGALLDSWSVSPNGQLLLAVQHGKDGPFPADTLSAIDLRRRQLRELLAAPPGAHNLIEGAVWAADSAGVGVRLTVHQDSDTTQGGELLAVAPPVIRLVDAVTGRQRWPYPVPDQPRPSR